MSGTCHQDLTKLSLGFVLDEMNNFVIRGYCPKPQSHERTNSKCFDGHNGVVVEGLH